MESSQLVSWQSENFSAAELSPIISPVSPSSSLFYDGSNPVSPSGFKGHQRTTMAHQSQKPVSSVLSSRAQTASLMLNELERLHSYEDQAFGMGYKEESVDLNNMNLFEELADIEYTPPLFATDDAIEVPGSPVAASPAPMVPSVSVTQTSPSEGNAKLTTEFKAIVESLTTANATPSSKISLDISPAPVVANNMVAQFGDLIQIAGIPTTTVVGEECLVPVEFIGRSTPGGGLGAEEAESMDLDGIIISNDMEFINESELFELSAELIPEEQLEVNNSNAVLGDGVTPYWAKDLTVTTDELDSQMNKIDNTLDALIKGDVSKAKRVIASSSNLHPEAFSPVSTFSDDDDAINLLETAEVVEVLPLPPKPVVEPEPQKKPERRRGRKPAGMRKDPLTYVRDKALRKKEQNKTAATRYRQKKKQELVITLAEEEELQKVHDELVKEKEKIGSEVRMMRSLLRDMLQVRRKRVTPSPSSVAVPLSAGRLTASSIVQAQKIANRRK